MSNPQKLSFVGEKMIQTLLTDSIFQYPMKLDNMQICMKTLQKQPSGGVLIRRCFENTQ